MTTRTFVMTAALIVFGGVVATCVIELQTWRAERRVQRVADELKVKEEKAKAELLAAVDRRGALTALGLAVKKRGPSPRMDKLDRRLIVAMGGDRSDPKIEAMAQQLVDQFRDASKTEDELDAAIEELATKLVREYKP